MSFDRKVCMRKHNVFGEQGERGCLEASYKSNILTRKQLLLCKFINWKRTYHHLLFGTYLQNNVREIQFGTNKSFFIDLLAAKLPRYQGLLGRGHWVSWPGVWSCEKFALNSNQQVCRVWNNLVGYGSESR